MADGSSTLVPRRATARMPDALIEARYAALLQKYHEGDLEAAEADCAAALVEAPQHAGLMQLMGVLRARRGEFVAAIEFFDRAIAADPEMGSLHNNRGHALLALHRLDEATASYDRAIELQREDASALNNRGTALQDQLRFDEALDSFARAIAVEPGFAAAHRNRGELLLETGQREAGIEALRRAREAGADAQEIGFTLASLGAEAPADIAPTRFVRDLFDGYAQNFDEHLTGRLEYRGPELVRAAVGELDLPDAPRIVDLGCGTGLCAPVLKPLAGWLEGVDLSSNMLERAHRLDLYDALACGDLVEHLQARPRAFDLAVAADVLIYFGDLAPTFAAVHASLRPRGWFVFSVECGDTDPFELRQTRRFAHAMSYVEAVAIEQGFDVSWRDDVVLRTEGRVDVAGGLFVLRRRDSPRGDHAS